MPGMIRPAFLVSDEALKSLRTEPWVIGMEGEAIFMHDSVLKILKDHHDRSAYQPIKDGSRRGAPGPFFCDQPDCIDFIEKTPFKTYAVRNYHRSVHHGIPGDFSTRRKRKSNRKQIAHTKMIEDLRDPQKKTANGKLMGRPRKIKMVSDGMPAGKCGIGECDFYHDTLRILNFHRSMKHGVHSSKYEITKQYRDRAKRRKRRTA
jgi:hypothetical protein